VLDFSVFFRYTIRIESERHNRRNQKDYEENKLHRVHKLQRAKHQFRPPRKGATPQEAQPSFEHRPRRACGNNRSLVLHHLGTCFQVNA